MDKFTSTRESFLSNVSALSEDVCALQPSLQASLASEKDVDERVVVLQQFIKNDNLLQDTLSQLQHNVDMLSSKNTAIEANIAAITLQKDHLLKEQRKNKKRRITFRNTSSELEKLLHTMDADSKRAKHLIYTIEQTSSVERKSVCRLGDTDAFTPFLAGNAVWHQTVTPQFLFFVCIWFDGLVSLYFLSLNTCPFCIVQVLKHARVVLADGSEK